MPTSQYINASRTKQLRFFNKGKGKAVANPTSVPRNTRTFTSKRSRDKDSDVSISSDMEPESSTMRIFNGTSDEETADITNTINNTSDVSQDTENSQNFIESQDIQVPRSHRLFSWTWNHGTR
jgi:hypothetical protein